MRAVVVTAALMVSGLGFVGYRTLEHKRFVQSLASEVKNTSLRVSNSAQYELEANSQITYAELFQKLEADVQEIDKNILQVQTISSPETAETTDPTLEYLRASQVCLRALVAKYRKKLALTTATTSAEEALKDYKEESASSSYLLDAARRRSDDAIRQIGVAATEYKDTLAGLVTAVEDLEHRRDAIASIYSDDALVSRAPLDAVAKRNRNELSDASSLENGPSKSPEPAASFAPGPTSKPTPTTDPQPAQIDELRKAMTVR